jgi:hypothetical protein
MNFALPVRTRLTLRVKMMIKNPDRSWTEVKVRFRIGRFENEETARKWEELFLSIQRQAIYPGRIYFELSPGEVDIVATPDAEDNWDFKGNRDSAHQLGNDLHYEVQSRWNEDFGDAL